MPSRLRKWCEDGCILEPDGSWIVQVLPDDQGKVHVYRVAGQDAKDRFVSRILMQCRLLQFSENMLEPVLQVMWMSHLFLSFFLMNLPQFSHSPLLVFSPVLAVAALGGLWLVKLNWRSCFFDGLGDQGRRIDPAAVPLALLVRDSATWSAMLRASRPAVLRAVPWGVAWGLTIGTAAVFWIAFAACTPWAWVPPTSFGLPDSVLCRDLSLGTTPIWFLLVLAITPVLMGHAILVSARYAATGQWYRGMLAETKSS